MAQSSGMGTAGIVAIPIPADGPVNFQLTKQSAADYDMDWEPASGGSKGIIEANSDYQVKAGDTIINCNGTFNVTLIPIADANATITITSVLGTITVLADAAIQIPVELSSGTGSNFYPARSQWFQS